ncbi:MAG TPA: alpha-2-macroglobulin family protein, partial [Bacteroidales bacterium]|nr:alpha-2-macroglobulin family protein [Bacteroidales bacterium]
MKSGKFVTCTCILILFAILNMPLAFSQTGSSGWYNERWKKADSLSSVGLPKSALTVVTQVYERARSENNPGQFTRAILYRIRLDSEFREDALANAIYDVRSEIRQAGKPEKQVLNSILAELYLRYYNENYYRFSGRTQVMTVLEDSIQTWDLNTLARRITRTYLLSLEDPMALQAIPVGRFLPVLDQPDGKKNKPDLFRPTLYDFLAWRALDYFMGKEYGKTMPADTFQLSDRSYFAQPEEFSKLPVLQSRPADTFSLDFFAIRTFRDLAAFHLADRDPAALIDEELQRFTYVYDNCTLEDKDSLYVSALKRFESDHLSSPGSADILFAIAQYLAGQGALYKPGISDKHKWEIRDAAASCEQAISRFPESDGGKNCSILLKAFHQPSLKITSENAVIPETPSLALLEFSNLPAVYFRLATTDPESDREKTASMSREDLVTYYSRLPYTKSWDLKLPSDGDLQEHRAEIEVPGMPAGFYILEASSDPDFRAQDQTFAYVPVFVTSLSYISQHNESGGMDFYILDRESGKPVPDVSAESFVTTYNYSNRAYEIHKSGEYRSDPNGFFTIPPVPQGSNYANYFLRLKSGNDLLLTEHYYQYSKVPPVEKPVLRTFLFTDRAIYRPGQVIYFKGILLENTGDHFAIKPGVSTTVTFSDVNYQKISEQTLTTNEYGSFNGSFIAPTGVLPGQMSLANGSGTVTFRVEEYKRPTFEVAYEPLENNYRLNDSVTLTGKATAYAGNAIDGAKVSYRVVRTARFPFWDRWWIPFPESPEVEIAHGTAVTAPDGTVTVKFPALPDKSLSPDILPVFDYRITLDVTDLNGETESADGTVSVGYNSLLIGIAVPEKLNTATDSIYPLITTNLNGRKTPTELTVTVQRLRQPDLLLRKRAWSEPDLHLIGEADFRNNFPYDVYDEEDKPSSWPVEETVYEKTLNTATDSAIRSADLASPGNSAMRPGVYRFRLSAKDPYGEEVHSDHYVTVFEPNTGEVPVHSMNWFVPLKVTCEPGEKALFLLGSQDDLPDVICETRVHDTLVSRAWMHIQKQQKLIEIPVLEKYRGGFQVTFLFIRHNRSYQNSQFVSVPFTNKMLDITFGTFRDKLDPGQEEEWSLKITNSRKKGVEAELLASMYDASLDAFAPNSWDLSLYRTWYSYLNWNISDAFTSRTGIYYPLFPSAENFISPAYDQLNWFGYTSNSSRYYRAYDMKKTGDQTMAIPMQANEVGGMATGAQPPAPPETTPEGAGQKSPVKKVQEAPVVQIRRDFRETAFFYPNLESDSSGDLLIKFKVPESLTRWKFMGLAYTKQLEVGQVEKELITHKDLMVFPNAPRFVRQGDTVVFSTKVVNMSDHEVEGAVTLSLSDAVAGKPLDLIRGSSSLTFRAAKGQSALVSWTLVIPAEAGLTLLQYRVAATAGNFSDGEEKTLPVLTNRMLVTESLPLPVRGQGNFTFSFGKLLESGASQTRKNYRLTLEFASNPSWYAVQALSLMDEPVYPSADNIFQAYYANSIACFLANSNPAIRKVFDSWKNLTPDALLSNLEKNQQLKSSLLQETPWVLEARSESERKQKLANLFDKNTLSQNLQQNLLKLEKLQLPNGGWSWFEGMQESRYITQNIITGLGHLEHLGIKDVQKDPQATGMIRKAVIFLDGEMTDDFSQIRKHNPGYRNEDHLGSEDIQYLYARSYFLDEIPLGSSGKWTKAQVKEAFDYFTRQAVTYWLKNDLYFQGMIALALNRLGNKTVPVQVLQSLSEKAQHSDEMGMYWAMQEGFGWYQAPIETESLLIEAYDEITGDQKSVDEMKIWLLKQKQTQDWRTGRATAEACYALLLRGTDLLSGEPNVKIRLGNETIDPAKLLDNTAEAGTGYFQVSWTGSEIVPEMGHVSVDRTGEGVAWGAVYWQYFEDLDKITPAKSPLKLEKKLFLLENTAAGPVLRPLSSEVTLHTGDKLIVR